MRAIKKYQRGGKYSQHPADIAPGASTKPPKPKAEMRPETREVLHKAAPNAYPPVRPNDYTRYANAQRSRAAEMKRLADKDSVDARYATNPAIKNLKESASRGFRSSMNEARAAANRADSIAGYKRRTGR